MTTFSYLGHNGQEVRNGRQDVDVEPFIRECFRTGWLSLVVMVGTDAVGGINFRNGKRHWWYRP